MKAISIYTIVILGLLVAPLAHAGQATWQKLKNGCYEFKLCDELASDGDCDYASFYAGYSHTLYAESSTDTTFTCTMRSALEYSATVYGSTDPAITVSSTTEVQPFDALLKVYWLNCDKTDNGGATTVTVYDYACPLAP